MLRFQSELVVSFSEELHRNRKKSLEYLGVTRNAKQANILRFIWFDFWLAVDQSWTGDKEIQSGPEYQRLFAVGRFKMLIESFLDWRSLKYQSFTFSQPDVLHPSQAT